MSIQVKGRIQTGQNQAPLSIGVIDLHSLAVHGIDAGQREEGQNVGTQYVLHYLHISWFRRTRTGHVLCQGSDDDEVDTVIMHTIRECSEREGIEPTAVGALRWPKQRRQQSQHHLARSINIQLYLGNAAHPCHPASVSCP
jgi:hypothetical protein